MAVSLGENIQITGFVATGDQSANQWRPVKAGSTAGTVKLAVATTDKMIGILVNNPKTGKAAEIVAAGNTKGKVTKQVVVGDFLSPNSTGNLAPITAGRAVAVALEAAGSTGDIRAIFVTNFKI